MNTKESSEKKESSKPIEERKPVLYQGILVLPSKDGKENYEDQRLIQAYQQGFRFIQTAGLDHIVDGPLEGELSSGHWSDPVDKFLKKTHTLCQFSNYDTTSYYWNWDGKTSKSKILFGVVKNNNLQPDIMLHYTASFSLDKEKRHAPLPMDLLRLLNEFESSARKNKSELNIILNTDIDVNVYYTCTFENMHGESKPACSTVIADLDCRVREYRKLENSI